MSFRKRLLLLLLAVLLLGALDALLAPLFLPAGLRLWFDWAAKREGVRVEIGKIEAPFLKPIRIERLRVNSPPGAAREIAFRADHIVAELNFRGLFFSRQSAFLRAVKIEQLDARIRLPAEQKGKSELDWRLLSRLLPDNFHIDRADLDFATPEFALTLRQLLLSASAIESGKFSAREVTLRSAIFRRTFLDLRGATAWEGHRLTIAGLPLVRGLDLETLTLDLSRLARKRLGLDLQLDAYGGGVRISLQQRAGHKGVLEAAGSASNVSLAQIASALGFVEPISGRLHAAKFTFRGNPGQFLDGTASVWMELTDFAWRVRRADSVMLGATYYDRRLEVEQLYVRQHENQLTINGELRWPKKGQRWTELPFRGQLNATIPDLNSFAKLFGASTGDFSGALVAEGNLDALTTEARGRLELHGKGASYREVALDSLGAALELRGSELTLEKFEARHGQDFLRGEGEIDLHSPHRFSGRITGAINDLAAYAPLLPAEFPHGRIAGGATFDWQGDGTLKANSGTMQFYAHGLQLPFAPLRMPLDITLEGSYSPQDVFFRTFQVGNDRVWLGGFLMLGSNFIELQSIRLTLDGAPRITGTVFLPLSARRWWATRRFLDGLDPKQKSDVDLVISHLDLQKLGAALGETLPVSGVLDGRLAAFGSLGELQLTGGGRLASFGGGSPDDLVTFDAWYGQGRAQVSAAAFFGKSAPLHLDASIPLRLEKKPMENGTVLDRAAPFSLTASCSALFLENLPEKLRPFSARGLLSGSINFSNSLGAPHVSGEAQILGADFLPPPPWPEVSDLSADLRFTTAAAISAPLRAQLGGNPLLLNASLTTSPPEFRLTMEPAQGELGLINLPASGSNLSSVRIIGRGSGKGELRLARAVVRGKIGSSAASLTIYSEKPDGNDPLAQQTTLFLRPRSIQGEPLLLRSVPPPQVSLGVPNERQTRSQ